MAKKTGGAAEVVKATNFDLNGFDADGLAELLRQGQELLYQKQKEEREKSFEDKKNNPKVKALKKRLEALKENKGGEYSNEIDLTLEISNTPELFYDGIDLENRFDWHLKGKVLNNSDKQQLMEDAFRSILEYDGEDEFFYSMNMGISDYEEEVQEFLNNLAKKKSVNRKIPVKIKLTAYVSHLPEIFNDFVRDLEDADGKDDSLFSVSYDSEVVSSELTKKEKEVFEQKVSAYTSEMCFEGLNFVPDALKANVKFAKEVKEVASLISELQLGDTFNEVLGFLEEE